MTFTFYFNIHPTYFFNTISNIYKLSSIVEHSLYYDTQAAINSSAWRAPPMAAADTHATAAARAVDGKIFADCSTADVGA